MDISRASSDKLLVKYATKNDKKEEIFHSSGYAVSQSGANLGASGGGNETFSARRNINDDRQYVRGYKDSHLTNSYLGGERAKARANAAAAIAQINGRNNGNDYTNLADVAEKRAQDAISGTMGQPSAGLRNRIAGAQGAGAPSSKPQPILSSARAPQVPTRRSGI